MPGMTAHRQESNGKPATVAPRVGADAPHLASAARALELVLGPKHPGRHVTVRSRPKAAKA